MYDSAQKRTFLNHATTRNFKENGRSTMKTAKNPKGSVITPERVSSYVFSSDVSSAPLTLEFS